MGVNILALIQPEYFTHPQCKSSMLIRDCGSHKHVVAAIITAFMPTII